MQDSEDGKASRQVSAHDAKVETYIDALRALADDAEQAEMKAYAQILDEAFKRCLLHYLSEKKAALDQDLSNPPTLPPKTLN